MRSQLFSDELVGRGGIASIGLSAAEIGVLLGQYQGRLEIAGVIGPHAVTVAGAIDALKDLVAQLNRRSIPAEIIPASIPSHCAFVTGPCASDLRRSWRESGIDRAASRSTRR